jgi:transcription-repair coupling factor (superfamily II helicase)
MLTGMMPIRIELFGDEIDRMGLFDVESQRIHTVVTGCEIPPAREVLINEETRAALRAAVADRLKKSKDERAIEELKTELAEIDGGGEIRFADKYLTLIDPARECLLSYFSIFSKQIKRINQQSVVQKQLIPSNLWRLILPSSESSIKTMLNQLAMLLVIAIPVFLKILLT